MTLDLLSPASAQAVELPTLLDLLAELAASDLGRTRIQALEPFTDEEALTARRHRYQEADRLVADRPLVPAFETPLADLLERLDTGRPPVTGPDLVRLAALLVVAGCGSAGQDGAAAAGQTAGVTAEASAAPEPSEPADTSEAAGGAAIETSSTDLGDVLRRTKADFDPTAPQARAAWTARPPVAVYRLLSWGPCSRLSLNGAPPASSSSCCWRWGWAPRCGPPSPVATRSRRACSSAWPSTCGSTRSRR